MSGDRARSPGHATALDSCGQPLAEITLDFSAAIPNAQSLWVSELARTLVLSRNGTELARLPVDLVDGEVTELRY